MRRDFESKGLVVVAFNSGVDKDRKIRRYLEAQEFTFATVLKAEHSADVLFGMRVSGSSLLIGPDGRVLWRAIEFNPKEIRRVLDAMPAPK